MPSMLVENVARLRSQHHHPDPDGAPAITMAASQMRSAPVPSLLGATVLYVVAVRRRPEPAVAVSGSAVRRGDRIGPVREAWASASARQSPLLGHLRYGP